jgi:hypothetical protein
MKLPAWLLPRLLRSSFFVLALTLFAAAAEARYYHASLGGWITRDPSGYADSRNLYEAVSSDPVSLIDPYGLIVKLPKHRASGLPEFNVADTLAMDYSSESGMTREQMSAAATKRVETAFAGFAHTRSFGSPNVRDPLTQGDSGFSMGWDFEVGRTNDADGTCRCSYTGTRWKFKAWYVVAEEISTPVPMFFGPVKEPGGSIVIGPDGRDRQVDTSSVREHESWHTGGLPAEVLKKAAESGLAFKGEKVGYAGQARLEMNAANQKFGTIVINKRDPETGDINNNPSYEWCRTKGMEIMEKHLIGDEAFGRIRAAGVFHLPNVKGVTAHFFNAEPVPSAK